MGGLVSERAIEEIKQRTSLVGLIGEHVKLTRSGRSHKGCCPFHQEKTPSFYVHDDQGFYYCFGCSARGDAIAFLTDHLGYSFREALEHLSDRTGVPLPEVETAAPPGARRQRRETRDRYLDLNAVASRWFQAQLGDEALAYLRDKRGLTDETIARYELGWAPDSWDGLTNGVVNSFSAQRDAISLGLIAQGSRGPYDRFRGRIMFPVFDRAGKVAGFSGRTLSKDDETPKYINSSESDVFTKGKLLYGLHQARKAIRAAGRVIVVEGNVDVLTLAQHGFEETVAPMGTALTEEQCELVKRFAGQVVLIYDGDRAGRAAALKAIPMLLHVGVNGRVVLLPDGEDPDTLVKERGAAAMQALIDEAPPLFDAVLDDAMGDYDGTVPGKARVLGAIKSTFGLLTEAEQAEYTRRLSRLLGMWEQELQKQLGRRVPEGPPPSMPEPPSRSEQGGPRGPERDLLVLLLHHPEELLPQWVDGQADGVTDAEWVTHPGIRAAIEAAWDLFDDPGYFDGATLVSRLEAAGMANVGRSVAKILFSEDHFERDPQGAYEATISELKRRADKRDQERRKAALMSLPVEEQLAAIAEQHKSNAVGGSR